MKTTMWMAMLAIIAATANAACTRPPRNDWRCGPRFNDAQCYPGNCCSTGNWCGNEWEHCNPDICAGSVSTFDTQSRARRQQEVPQTLERQPRERRSRTEASRQQQQDGTAASRQQQQDGTAASRQQQQDQQRSGPVMGARREITEMSSSELREYRDAWSRITAGGLNSIYQRIAQDHGQPNFFCPHGSEKFLPWHRRYVARIEEALQVPLAFWDWTKSGIPAAFQDVNYRNSAGRIVENPLRANLLPTGLSTTRSANPFLPRSRFERLVSLAQRQNDFSTFTSQLESVHDSVHGGIGQTMGIVSLASYDPIFWAHHCFVDYLWWTWQLNHPNVQYGDDATGTLQDSIGDFLGSGQIADQSGWRRGRSTDAVRFASASGISSISSEPQLFLTLKRVPSIHASTNLTVVVDDVEVASEVRFGMQGMPITIIKDVTMNVDPEKANDLWVKHNIAPDEIPTRAKVFRTVNGRKMAQLQSVEIEAKWEMV